MMLTPLVVGLVTFLGVILSSFITGLVLTTFDITLPNILATLLGTT
ncbi:MAG: hypothetical protein V3T70_01780 [Phycisphaerae bacterium]